ncbi:phenylalanine--tRNA ligase subunit alpha [Candidatus Gottesmanbacteria bacterium]|nr:phenylalanine--tRNA ligase subunit alpha [Candidatus Gottesmanbacteria bacterium]
MEQELKKLREETDKRIEKIKDSAALNKLYLNLFGASGSFTKLLKTLKTLPAEKRPAVGKLANEIKKQIEDKFSRQRSIIEKVKIDEWLDVTAPGLPPQIGHLHIVTQAISEISRIFERVGFTRVRYPEVEYEWYAFESLNMPANHPARDDFETFFLDTPSIPKMGQLVLSPHTSSGQVREMKRLKKPPIRMINIAKCYRPNWDISHTPMFHQFEGLVVDTGINITHLKGTMDYFAREFFGKDRKTRLRPFHFQFTEPSFEVDISCGVCLGKGKLTDGNNCRFCKEGWLELGGSGMVHPNVLKMGNIDPVKYSGFAFGWGVERTYMMKSGTKLDDIRLLYSNDIRFLEQF